MAGREMDLLLETCLAIALGFLIVDVVSRIVLYAKKMEYRVGKKTV